jgi:hypothetical protein
MKGHRDYTYSLMAIAILLQLPISLLTSAVTFFDSGNNIVGFGGLWFLMPFAFAPAPWTWVLGSLWTRRLPEDRRWRFWRWVPPLAIASSFLTLLYALPR